MTSTVYISTLNRSWMIVDARSSTRMFMEDCRRSIQYPYVHGGLSTLDPVPVCSWRVVDARSSTRTFMEDYRRSIQYSCVHRDFRCQIEFLNGHPRTMGSLFLATRGRWSWHRRHDVSANQIITIPIQLTHVRDLYNYACYAYDKTSIG